LSARRTAAALYDVHGNLPALDAVLHEVETAAPELVIVGGDVALGPMPHEVLERLRGLAREVLFVRGNTDREAAAGEGEQGAWVAARLAAEERAFLAALPLVERAEIEDLGRVVFCHATPRSDEEIVTLATPEARMRDVLATVEAEVVVCGHVHVRYDRVVAGKRVVNPGSVGLPYEREPGAYWALFGPDVSLRRTEYDVAGAVEAIRATGFPGVEEMFAETLLRPPRPDEVTSYFEGMALARP
jgi:putative phosphoesterase